MKVTLVVVCLLSVFACVFAGLLESRQVEDTCKTWGCVALDAACESDFYTADADCAGNDTTTCPLVCQYPLRCTHSSNDVATTCKATTLDQLCTTTADCTMAYHEHMVCSGGRCAIDTSLRLPNDFCSSSSNCLGSSTCVDGRCTGLELGSTCTATTQCNPGLYCSVGGTCAERDNAATCVSSDSCTFTYSCIAGSCIADYTRTSGQSCNSDWNCAEGLVCTVHQGEVLQTCRVPSSPEEGSVCDEQSDCTGDTAFCACDLSGNDRCYVADGNGCVDADNTYYSCLENAGCHFSSDLFRLGSCASVACGGLGVSSVVCAFVVETTDLIDACHIEWSSASSMTSWLSVFLAFF